MTPALEVISPLPESSHGPTSSRDHGGDRHNESSCDSLHLSRHPILDCGVQPNPAPAARHPRCRCKGNHRYRGAGESGLGCEGPRKGHGILCRRCRSDDSRHGRGPRQGRNAHHLERHAGRSRGFAYLPVLEGRCCQVRRSRLHRRYLQIDSDQSGNPQADQRLRQLRNHVPQTGRRLVESGCGYCQFCGSTTGASPKKK